MIIGIDPGLLKTGWVIINSQDSNLYYVDGGLIKPPIKNTIEQRLLTITTKLEQIITKHSPNQAAIEEIFVNKNPESTLKLGMARAAAMLAPARYNLDVFEYPPNKIKKTVVGSGHASKEQVIMMVNQILPKANITSSDMADAAATAICHYQHSAINQMSAKYI